MASAIETRSHEAIRRWTQDRGGVPAIVKGTDALLRIDFVEGAGSGGHEDGLEEVTWDQWFAVFDDRDLQFLHSPEPESRFFKLVNPTQTGAKAPGRDEMESKDQASDTTIYDQLHAEHEQVQALFEELMEAKGAASRARIFGKLSEELLRHARAEAKVLYKKLEDEGDEARFRALEGDEEHEVVEDLLARLSKDEDKGSDRWLARAKVLKEVVEHHVEEEESKMFKEARKALDKGEAKELNARYLAGKDGVKMPKWAGVS